MPAFDYDYDYFEKNRVSKAATAKNVKKHSNENTKPQSSQYSTRSGTRQATKEQIRKIAYENAQTLSSASTKNNYRHVAKTTTKTANRAAKELEIPTFSSTRKKQPVSKKQTVVKSKPAKKAQVNKRKPEELKLKKPSVSSAQKRKAKEKFVSRAKMLVGLLAGFSIAFLICYRYSLINERFNQVEKKKQELVTARTVNEQIQADIDSQTDLSYIENFAKYQLGMQKPSNSQIVYVNVEKEDRIITPVSVEEEKEKNWFDKLYDKIMKLF